MNSVFLQCCRFAMICSFSLVFGSREALAETPPSKAENFHLFLLAGQSNMAGRGKVTLADKKPYPRVFALNRHGEWVPAVDPVHWDKSSAGTGLGRSFAMALVDANPHISIGLIPAACGGSPIEVWQPGKIWRQTKSAPYDDAVARARQAMKQGILKGILWHQGESDATVARAPLYGKALTNLIQRFRQDLKSPELPVVIGQLGQFKERPWNEHRKQVDAAQQAVAKADAHVTFVGSDGLKCKSDRVHFNADSLREFGRRYAQTYQQLMVQKAEK